MVGWFVFINGFDLASRYAITDSLVVISNVTVGRDFPNERALALSEGFLGECQGARAMISSEITGSGGARSEGSGDNLFIDMPSELVILVIDLEGNSVRIEPVQQLHVEAQTDIRELWRMNVAVDESRYKELFRGQFDAFCIIIVNTQLLEIGFGITTTCGDLVVGQRR